MRQDGVLTDRVAIVTGAGRGIGKSIALALAAHPQSEVGLQLYPLPSALAKTPILPVPAEAYAEKDPLYLM